MSATFDFIVLGAGGFGSSAIYHLSKRGARVLGLERFGVAHDRGSSHGETRVIRKAYFEHSDYVPLLLRAYELWRELEAECGEDLYHEVGLVIGGMQDSDVVTGAKIAVAKHALTIESLTAAEGRKRFPTYNFPEEFSVVYEPEAGYLDVEACVRAHLDAAVKYGADLHVNETVIDWRIEGPGVRVRTDRGEYAAGGLIISAGAWSRPLLADLNVPLEVLRKVLLWYETPAQKFDVAAGNPCFFFETAGGEFYGFPRINGRVKLAEHTGGETVADPLLVDRSLRKADTVGPGEFIAKFMPDLPTRAAQHVVCMYTKTPDSHFIVDRHPEHDNVVIGAGFSGHGFKFTSSIGEVLADLVDQKRAALPIEFLSLGREALRA
ncbi:Monomeric sarcosine oxidase [Symmachiella macrocystis]|uniref:Monomeric sarcosine oxidase n=1 Tax=Symmachiella macrocystis TaxID=2527985 RepID=A0A5C6BLF3_9PLAN|nr:N-methyl-L-tryptophan oxidase [Symmachiella macrocystis]TWU11314.1 Monomeric sarcosine oxidase [Symmachiella macrocystis]